MIDNKMSAVNDQRLRAKSPKPKANSCQWAKGLIFFVLIVFQVKPSLSQTFSTDKNHIVTKTAMTSGITTSAGMDGQVKENVAISVSYMDRLGRPTQSIAKQASPLGKDVVSFNEYDSYGLQSTSFLPYTATTTNALYKTTAKTDQEAFFNNSGNAIADDTAPWSHTTIERSPLKRTLDQNSPGAAWQNKLTRYEYTVGADNVLRWEITSNGELRLPGDISIFNTDYYGTGELMTSIVKDDDWISGNDHTTKTYTDYLGRTILNRTYMGGNQYDTYYVYDNHNNLRFVIPPKAIKAMLDASIQNINDNNIFDASQTFPASNPKDEVYYYLPGIKVTLPAGMTFTSGFALKPYPLNADINKDLLYVNEYDGLNRLISKKVPGAEPVYYIYDKINRLILSQDGNQRNINQWTFTKYDRFIRPVLTGLYSDSRDPVAMQAYVDIQFANVADKYEKRGSAIHGYTNDVFPHVNDENDYLVVSYYDDYDFKSSWGTTFNFDNTNGINNGPNIQLARGLETGGKIKVLGENTWLRSVKFYDYDLQLIQGVSEPYTGQTEKIFTKYNFTGDLTESLFEHTTDGGKVVSVNERYEYDHAGRLERQYHSIDGEPEVLMADYEYDELGELVDKQLHSTDGGTAFIQSVDYRYNIRGWLTNINKSDRTNLIGDTDANTDLYGMELYYNDDHTDASLNFTTQTNGLLAGTTWGHAAMPPGTTQRSFGYTYDNVNRLNGASYLAKNTSWNVQSGYYNVSGLQYDYNGNITDLVRKSNNTNIDDLDYTYDGNQLQSINDNTTSDDGFKDGAEASVEYTYDSNGNMISDANKLITSTTYNLLNKPDRITFSNGDYIQYTYDAAGTKLKQLVNIGGSTADETEYSSGLIFESGVLSLMSMPQGRIMVDKIGDDYNYDYQYFLTDHLGNNRVMFAPQERIYTATMESEDATEEEAQFLNIASTRNLDAVYSRSGNEASRLNAYDGKVIGPAKGLKLYSGDVVDMEVWVKYDTPNSTNQAGATTIHSVLSAAYGVSSGGAGELGDIYDGLGDALGSGGLIAQGQNDTPAAYLNYIFLDSNFDNPVGGFIQADVTGSANAAFDSLGLAFTASQEGYLFVYLSNESKLDVDVYFDDFKITHTSSASVLQADDYYPFGLPITALNHTQTGIEENRFLYQGKEWQTDLALNLYDFHARQYDPATGRFTGIDPAGQFHSPYLGMGNMPTMGIDPDGRIFGITSVLLAKVVSGALIGAGVGATTYTVGAALSEGGFDNWNLGGFLGSFGTGALHGGISGGLDKLSGLGKFAGLAAGGTAFTGSLIQGGDLGQALFSGFASGLAFGLSSNSGIKSDWGKFLFEAGTGAAYGAAAAAATDQDVIWGAFYGAAGAAAGAGVNGDLGKFLKVYEKHWTYKTYDFLENYGVIRGKNNGHIRSFLNQYRNEAFKSLASKEKFDFEAATLGGVTGLTSAYVGGKLDSKINNAYFARVVKNTASGIIGAIINQRNVLEGAVNGATGDARNLSKIRALGRLKGEFDPDIFSDLSSAYNTFNSLKKLGTKGTHGELHE